MRTAEINRKTKETDISLWLDLDGNGENTIDTGCGFFNHMMELFSSHGNFDIRLKCVGDVQVDYHHTVEDCGIALGQAFALALGDKGGINRYGDIILPMDEVLMLCAVDISGRAYLGYDVEPENAKVGDFDTELVQEFLLAFVREAKVSLHFVEFYGVNTHHILEAVFKAFARTMRKAAAVDASLNGKIPSSKGTI